ncbi:MAG: response regulator [Solobacterium sp.]|nr:response regulator [Solobacterium sp.]
MPANNMNVVIIDDDHEDLLRVQQCLHQILGEMKIPYKILTSDSFSGLSPQPHTFYVLDIDMPGQDGFKIAKEINDWQPSSAIVFCTNHMHLIHDAMRPNTLYFVNKSNLREQMTLAVKKYIANRGLAEDFQFQFMKHSFSIPWSDIICFNTSGNNLLITVTNTPEPYAVHKSMKSIRDDALKNHFISCTSSYMINMYHIKTIKDPYVYLSEGKKIKAGARAIRYVEEARLSFLLRL